MFSVVIPLYNKAHTIKNTLQSVLNQTFTGFEVIVVDDGSTDRGTDVIRQFTKDIRIRIVHQENQGVSVARNRGIMEAKNDWIAFLDADDEWLSNYLTMVDQAISKLPEVGIVFTGRYSQNIQSGKRTNKTPVQYRNKISIIEFFHNPHVFSHISATTVNRALLHENIGSWGGFVPGQKCNEDFTFFFRTALHTKVGYCGYPLSIYNSGVPGQATSSLAKTRRLADSIVFHNLVIKEWIRTNCQNKAFKIFMKYEMRHFFYNHLKTNNTLIISQFINGIDTRYKHFFSKSELFCYQQNRLNQLMRLFVITTKIRWRLRGYPRVI